MNDTEKAVIRTLLIGIVAMYGGYAIVMHADSLRLYVAVLQEYAAAQHTSTP